MYEATPRYRSPMKNMKPLIVTLLLVLLAPAFLYSQARVRKLPSTLNHPSFNAFAPYLSADANAIVFLSDNAEDNVLAPFYTTRDNADWKEPQMLPKSIYTRLNFLRGFALNADGKKLFFTTMKTPSVGGYDIWTSDWKGNTWSEPVNLGMPVNSKGYEASPSLAADGSAIYFMRCETMDQNKAGNCKIFRAGKKQNGQWDEPVELPASINTGNSQAPRIMADGETLIFSSDKMPGNKGGMDLYSTKFINGSWSKPMPWDFVNTEKDDQYISVAALGRYIVKDAMGQRRNELMEYLIPDQLRPRGMMKVDGKVSDIAGNPIPAYISITDIVKNKKVYNGRPYTDGSFIVYVMEGSKYELAVDPEQDNISYFSKQLDLTTDKIPQVEKVSVTIKPLAVNDEFSLDMISFKPYSSEIDAAASSAELKRFMRVVKGNSNVKFEILVLLNGYLEDSVRSNPDLTEVIYDSIHTTFDDIDTLGQLYERDTVMVKTTYHNDRTRKQAEAIAKYLVKQGASESSFGFFGNAIPATIPEQKKLTIKAMVRPKK
jgi:hypothetical protein